MHVIMCSIEKDYKVFKVNRPVDNVHFQTTIAISLCNMLKLNVFGDLWDRDAYSW